MHRHHRAKSNTERTQEGKRDWTYNQILASCRALNEGLRQMDELGGWAAFTQEQASVLHEAMEQMADPLVEKTEARNG